MAHDASIIVVIRHRLRQWARRRHGLRSGSGAVGSIAGATMVWASLGLHRHDLLLFRRQMLFYERDMLVGNVLDLFFGVFGFILAKTVLL